MEMSSLWPTGTDCELSVVDDSIRSTHRFESLRILYDYVACFLDVKWEKPKTKGQDSFSTVNHPIETVKSSSNIVFQNRCGHASRSFRITKWWTLGFWRSRTLLFRLLSPCHGSLCLKYSSFQSFCFLVRDTSLVLVDFCSTFLRMKGIMSLVAAAPLYAWWTSCCITFFFIFSRMAWPLMWSLYIALFVSSSTWMKRDRAGKGNGAYLGVYW